MRWGAAIVTLSVVAAVAINVLRLLYGVDFTDEALYVAVPWRFVGGDSPIVDEYNLTQLAALICVPFLKAWSALNGEHAIVLAVRVLHLLLRGFAAAVVAWSLAPILRKPLATVVALFTFAVVPFGIPSVSYNTVGVLSFTAGCFAGMARERGWRGPALAGALHAVAAITYPPMALAVAAFLMGRLLLARGAFLLPYFAAGAVAGLPFAIVFAQAGPDAVRRMVAFAASGSRPAPFLARLADMAGVLASAPPWYLLFGALAFLAAIIVLRSSRFAWLLLVVPLVAAFNRLPMLYTSIGFTAWVALIGAAATLVLWRHSDDARRIIACVLLPGLTAGLLTSFFSSNRAVNFGVGALAAAQAAIVLLVLMAQRLNAHPPVAFALAVVCFLIPTAQQFLPGTIYRDDDATRLTAVVKRGPYAGLRTTASKRDWLARLEKDLATVSRPGRRAIFFYDFPGGHLLTPMLPGAPSVWTLAGPDARRADDLPAWFSDNGMPDVAVRIKSVPYFREISDVNEFPPDDALNAAFAVYRIAIARSDYDVLVAPGL